MVPGVSDTKASLDHGAWRFRRSSSLDVSRRFTARTAPLAEQMSLRPLKDLPGAKRKPGAKPVEPNIAAGQGVPLHARDRPSGAEDDECVKVGADGDLGVLEPNQELLENAKPRFCPGIFLGTLGGLYHPRNC